MNVSRFGVFFTIRLIEWGRERLTSTSSSHQYVIVGWGRERPLFGLFSVLSQFLLGIFGFQQQFCTRALITGLDSLSPDH